MLLPTATAAVCTEFDEGRMLTHVEFLAWVRVGQLRRLCISIISGPDVTSQIYKDARDGAPSTA
jgi:hypothetical protein